MFRRAAPNATASAFCSRAQQAQRRAAWRFSPSVETLEERSTPAVTASFRAATGALLIQIDNDSTTRQYVYLGANRGFVYLNYDLDQVQGGPVPASAVRSITIIGSNLDNEIYMGWVTTADYLNLDGKIVVHGHGGKDDITGSQFADRLFGGGEDDTLVGGEGADRLFGQAGNDWLYGGADNDRLVGGSGRDWFTGDAGRDMVLDWQRTLNEEHYYCEIIRRYR